MPLLGRRSRKRHFYREPRHGWAFSNQLVVLGVLRRGPSGAQPCLVFQLAPICLFLSQDPLRPRQGLSGSRRPFEYFVPFPFGPFARFRSIEVGAVACCGWAPRTKCRSRFVGGGVFGPPLHQGNHPASACVLRHLPWRASRVALRTVSGPRGVKSFVVSPPPGCWVHCPAEQMPP